MVKSFILFTVALISLNAAPFRSTLSSSDPHLRGVIKKLEALPESNHLIEEALKEGSISVEITRQGPRLRAMWNSGERKIVIDGRADNSQGALLRHLLFELTNAVADSKFDRLFEMAMRGHIGCDAYVEAVEKIEHDNMIYTTEILEKGIKAGIFPATAGWIVIYDFDKHYKIQQLAGHSSYIVSEYQSVAPRTDSFEYRGTVKNLSRLSQRKKEALIESLHNG